MQAPEFPPTGQLVITKLGRFIAEDFVFHREYLACISTDVDMYADYERKLLVNPSSFLDYSSNMCVLLEYLAVKEADMLQFLSRDDGLQEYCEIFGSTGFSPEIIQRLLENVLRLRSEDTVEEIIEKLTKLLSGDAVKKIKELVRRYGGEAR